MSPTPVSLKTPKTGSESDRCGAGFLSTGNDIFAALLAAIESAEKSIRLEMYIVRASPLADQTREALIRACARGVRVRFMVDAVGSVSLPDTFFEPLKAAGAECRWFNRIAHGYLAIRNHRKLLVCDDKLALIGGFNLAPEYHGDGVENGWRDVGLTICNSLVAPLAASFDSLFELDESRQKWFVRFRKSLSRQKISTPDGDVLLGGPGRSPNEMVKSFLTDLRRAKSVKIISAYFLPSRALRGALRRVVQRGGKVELILAGKSDVFMSQLAARHLYSRLLRYGIEIYEYQPQILHSKLFIIDNIVYAGSANMDRRSLYINYELLCRFRQPQLAEEARELFAADQKYSQQIVPSQWRTSRTLWGKLAESWAYFLLARVDPHLARLEMRAFAGG